MCQKRQETTGEIHLKWFGQKDLYLITLSGYFREHSSQVNNFLLFHEELHAQSKWCSEILGQPFILTRSILWKTKFIPASAPWEHAWSHDAIYLPCEICRKWIPKWTESLHYYSEWQCKIKNAEGCWKTNTWVKMEKFWEFPGGPEVGTPHFLVGELGSHRLRDAVRKKNWKSSVKRYVFSVSFLFSVNMRI